jgi:25S rRNA (uracil2843-N3)-methyltransferase
VLDLLRACCADALARPDAGAQLATIKERFVARDYDAIFSNPALLPVYAAHYAPGRALCYLDLFRTEAVLLRFLLRRPRVRVLCIGGGAGSEVVALAACRALLELRDPAPPASDGTAPAGAAGRVLDVHVYDMGDWAALLEAQAAAMRACWGFTGLGSAPSDSSEGDGAGELRLQVLSGDVLAAAAAGDAELVRQVARADLVTAMFVVNELFVARERAMALLALLHTHLRPGALLLVVDSAGDFSHLPVGRHTFMVYTLLDALRGWRRLVAHDAQWHRVPPGLRYPLELPHMRYFVRLYQRAPDPG